MESLYIFEQISRAANYGIGTYLRQLAVCGSMIGREVNVVYLGFQEHKFRVEEKEGIRYFYIPAVKDSELLDKEKESDRYYRCIVYLLRAYIVKEKRVFFHLNYNHAYTLVEALKSYWTNSQVFLTVHYLEWCFVNRGDLNTFRKIITSDCLAGTKDEKKIVDIYRREKRMFDLVDGIICLSRYTKQVLLHDYSVCQDKLFLTYNGMVDTAVCLDLDEREMLKAKFMIGTDEKIILFVGRLDDIKGVSYLIRAFRSVLQKKQKCRLVLVGDGDYSECLKYCSDIWSRVMFTGKLPMKQLQQLYQIADFGVMPSMHEQCSYVAIEMMMYGIPLIASNSTGLNEMVEEGVNGCKLYLNTFRKKIEVDVEELIQKILYLCEVDSITMEKLRRGARKMYEERYAMPLMVKAYDQIYRSI